MRTLTFSLLLAAGLAMSGSAGVVAQAQSDDDRPNFVIIVADDMGFSDMGSFGGEIPTPRLDQLAMQGIRYTNFYVAPSCSPTRSMLLTGVDHHLNGLGSMIERTAFNQEGQPGYEGVLNDRVATLPQILFDAGYHTYMTGKWHLGKDPEHIPAAKGFERDFTNLAAAGSHFNMTGNNWEVPDNQFTEDGEYITELPGDYYSTKTFTDKIIEQIESNRQDGQPFLAYVAHQAPHEPLQVPDNWLRRYMGLYDCGWDDIRSQRLDRLKAMGMVDPGAELAHRLWMVPRFNDMTGLARYSVARKMEVYAAMVAYMDMEIGRLVDYLEETGELDNTYIIIFSDNGPETQDKTAQAQQRPQMQAAGWLSNDYDTDFANWGRKNSHMGYGMPWAQASAAPFWLAKGSLGEGGVRAPLIVIPPRTNTNGAINTEAILHVQDIAPTLLDIAGVQHPTELGNTSVLPMQGESWVPMLEGDEQSVRGADDWLGFEFWGQRAVRRGPWKAVWMHAPFGTEEWELYDVVRDPGERVNRAADEPEILEEMVSLWDVYQRDNGVILPDRHQYDGMDEMLPPRPPVLGSWPPPSEENWNEPEDDEYFTCSVKSK